MANSMEKQELLLNIAHPKMKMNKNKKKHQLLDLTKIRGKFKSAKVF